MSTQNKWFVFFPVVLMAACNLPMRPGSGVVSPATLTPVLRLTEQPIDGLVFEDFFVEDFESGVPPDWDLDAGWDVKAGVLRSSSIGSAFAIPGEWPDMTLFLRFRFNGSGQLILRLSRAEIGTFEISISPDDLTAALEPVEDDTTENQKTDLALGDGWHDFVLRLSGKRAEVLIDEVLYYKSLAASTFPRGDIEVLNAGEELVEIDHLHVAPPSVGPGLPTPTASP